VHPHDRCAALEGPEGGGDGGVVAFGGGHREFTEEQSEEGFARGADHQWHADVGAQFGDRPQQRQVVLEGLAESDAGIRDDRVGRNSCVDGGRDPGDEKGRDVVDDVVVVRVELHRARLSAHVHGDVRGIRGGDDVEDLGIHPTARNVVHEKGTVRDRRVRDDRLGGVNADACAEGGDRGDDRNHAVDFFGRIDRRGAGTGRFAPNVDDVGSGGDQRGGVFDRPVDIDKTAAVGEGIGRDIENAHHDPGLALEEVAKG
jgi:hypothetical protein